MTLSYSEMRGQGTEPIAADAPSLAYSDIRKEDDERRRGQLRVVLDNAVKTAPAKAAEALKISQESGLPQDLVERQFEEVSRLSKVKGLDVIMRSSPILSEQMSNPDFAKVAWGDAENLSGLEHVTNALRAGWHGTLSTATHTGADVLSLQSWH